MYLGFLWLLVQHEDGAVGEVTTRASLPNVSLMFKDFVLNADPNRTSNRTDDLMMNLQGPPCWGSTETTLKFYFSAWLVVS